MCTNLRRLYCLFNNSMVYWSSKDNLSFTIIMNFIRATMTRRKAATGIRPILRRKDVVSFTSINGRNNIASFSRLSSFNEAKTKNRSTLAVILFKIIVISMMINIVLKIKIFFQEIICNKWFALRLTIPNLLRKFGSKLIKSLTVLNNVNPIHSRYRDDILYFVYFKRLKIKASIINCVFPSIP
ncbi:hypothetical protein KN1_28700 [Stygiolobus caldivivus]|uniref:Uncharacterized protein n=1 Tax=Stygiolobus caldivivus TaxID=2824673 RepID=A0A8D5U9Y4_9CREN|nr:hypothetical protein KN1_28700 [Stygiolobus caldivivus]